VYFMCTIFCLTGLDSRITRKLVNVKTSFPLSIWSLGKCRQTGLNFAESSPAPEPQRVRVGNHPPVQVGAPRPC
jgi:hypothetical protein